ncbi:type II secretion system F family protein [Thiothrix nivea]|uniref:Type II secretion system F domain-containing protein n=1 Tax=Thiothrix nivea (strain ATCC 35100 / DSM 5205 / JP2) TaxID=870187 RepID=A0A656HD96_THINJ|nr:type II secretion system F family protein [Thiothrix nivea]EIJ34343.1 Type II secretion system F domain-containing protein [Thiothrix nivea DSM 5205]
MQSKTLNKPGSTTPSAQQFMYVWEGANRNGVKMRGETLAVNPNWLRAELRRKGINPGRIYRKPKPLFKPSIKPADIAHFARQLTTMMRSGVPMVQSLELIATSSDNIAVRELVKKLTTDIEGGANLGNALARHPKYFDKLFVNLVKAGEQAGTLETMLEKVATYKEKSEALKAKIKKALMYPVIVIVAAVVVSAILLIWVIPQFKEVFSSFGADLPAFTLMVINLSDWLQANWWIPLLSFVAAGYSFTQARQRSKAFDRFVDRASLKMPIIGNILNLSAVARFSRTLSTMFAAGVPLVEAMDSVAGATGNSLYEDATRRMQDDTSRGVQLNTAMQTTQIFPNMVVQMTRIGEESGRLEEMLAKVADYYEEQVDNLVDTLAKQIEPLIMAVLGGIVGSLVIAMYLPIFKLGAVV